MKIVLPFIPRTKKNSMQIRRNNRTGKPFVSPSEAYAEYLNNCQVFLTSSTLPKGINSRVNVKCLFYMPTKRRVDLPNLLNAVDDAMVYHGLFEDDNSEIIAGHDGSRVMYDKEFPRTEIVIESM
ncbi:MAG: RusA family crossover junction endodeoxyribonuclease [Acidaminobacter sp.]|nr:RusA family crossover junction endodeoxyribonuclease [Acidaminobacter sp.]